MGHKDGMASGLNNMTIDGRVNGKTSTPPAYTYNYDTYDAYRRADPNMSLAEALQACIGKFTRHVDHMVHQMATQERCVHELIEVSKTNQELVHELLHGYVTDMKVAQGTADELRRRNAELEAELDALRG